MHVVSDPLLVHRYAIVFMSVCVCVWLSLDFPWAFQKTQTHTHVIHVIITALPHPIPHRATGLSVLFQSRSSAAKKTSDDQRHANYRRRLRGSTFYFPLRLSSATAITHGRWPCPVRTNTTTILRACLPVQWCSLAHALPTGTPGWQLPPREHIV